MQDEQVVVQRAKGNDPNAFAELYDEYFDKIYRYIAVKINNRDDAEDLTQQVFLKAHRSISSYKFKGVPFSAWLYRIAHNQIVDYIRKSSRKPDTLNEEIPVSDKVENDPEYIIEKKMEIKEVLAAARNLTDAQREVISLRFGGEMPTAQVAEIMGKSQGAVKALQHSAIVALRKALLAENNG
ncbi:MAG: sigma-70 family RNA polymerase sigma factor [Dehalococcoidales bacterium]|nr:sigma-70 family RNA polymerase sigma factor [Dehalococcoidales bacterium]